jgi:uncharacterized membrane protein (GlpM family)
VTRTRLRVGGEVDCGLVPLVPTGPLICELILSRDMGVTSVLSTCVNMSFTATCACIVS